MAWRGVAYFSGIEGQELTQLLFPEEHLFNLRAWAGG